MTAMSVMNVLRASLFLAVALAWLLMAAPGTLAQTQPRARDLGFPFEGEAGKKNSITDVEGVAVGHTTLIAGEGPLRVGEGPVRTGVTAILPRGTRSVSEPVFAGCLEWRPVHVHHVASVEDPQVGVGVGHSALLAEI